MSKTDHLDDVNVPSLTLPRPGPVELALLLALPLLITTLLLGLSFGGGAKGGLLIDAGDLVNYGLPIARGIHDGAAAVTIGLLVLATFILPGQKILVGHVSFSQAAAAKWACWSAAVWLAAAVGVLVLTAASILSTTPMSELFQRQFVFFATEIEFGQALSVSVASIAVVFVLLIASRSVNGIAFATAVSIFAVLPLALSGHAAGTDEHGNAVNSLAIHLVGVTVWVGGLVGLLLLRKKLGSSLPVVVGRYSTLAGWCYAAVLGSGIINASLRFTTPLELFTTTYGLLLTAKIVGFGLLGLAGAWYRRRIIPQLAANPTKRAPFARLATVEVLLMAAVLGISVALSRSAPPIPQTANLTADPRGSLIGFTYPPDVTFERMFTQFHPDWLFIAAAVLMIGLYLAGVRKLSKRAIRWPLLRTIPWVAGSLLLIYTTSGGPGVYGFIHFSTHMIQHMLLMMFVPPLLVLGAPILLAMRALPPRTDDSRGVREWILVLLHSRIAKLLTNPIVSAIVFAGGLVAFYYTDWFEFSLNTHQGHVFMCIHFLLTGYLFFYVLIGIDPGPSRPAYPIRLIILLATMAFHAFFGIALMSAADLLAIDWWHSLQQFDDVALLADQQVGGAIAWGAGELPVVLVALMVVTQWMRSDERTAKRLDRAADRDGDAELNEYNARLARLNERDRRDG